MATSRHRKNHKKKLNARKEKITQARNQYNNFMRAQIAAIQEQIKNQNASKVDLAKSPEDSSVDTEPQRGIEIKQAQ